MAVMSTLIYAVLGISTMAVWEDRPRMRSTHSMSISACRLYAIDIHLRARTCVLFGLKEHYHKQFAGSRPGTKPPASRVRLVSLRTHVAANVKRVTAAESHSIRS